MRQRGMMPQRYPARDSTGQAGICTPSIRSSLARSAVAYSVAARSVRPRMGRPTRASTSRLKPRLRPVTTTTMAARPMNRPARWLIMASQVRGDTRSRRRNMAPTLWHEVRGCHLIDPRERGEGNPTSLRAVRTMVPAPCRHGALCPMDTTRPARAPIVERVAGWSVRHRKTAVFGWLLLVVAAVMVGHQLGTRNVNSYDPGQAGRAERVLDRPVVQQPASESVLIQGRSAKQTYHSDPQVRQAVRDVVAALRAVPAAATDIKSPLDSHD